VKLSIFSAFPQEIKHVVKNTKAVQRSEGPFPLFLGRYHSSDIIVALTGIGGRNAETALAYVIKEYSPDFVFSIGFGGALYDGARIGEIIWGSRLFLLREDTAEPLELSHSADVLRRLPPSSSMLKGSILTLEALTKKPRIKEILPPHLPFPVSDMETFFLAKLAVERGIPFSALRSITDRADEEIPPEFLAVADESGQYKGSRALRLLFKPRLIKNITKIGRNSLIASNSLWNAVRSVIEVL
jgi:adenosylhomocysteine nucleosidase